MKIGLAQIQSYKGEIDNNIEKHICYIKKAIENNCEVVVFPELSITNYKPTTAKGFATTVEDEIFNPFQELAEKHKITICVGMPTIAEANILISMLIFTPNSKRKVYSKNMLHEDEIPFFSSGDCKPILNTSKHTIGTVSYTHLTLPTTSRV